MNAQRQFKLYIVLSLLLLAIMYTGFVLLHRDWKINYTTISSRNPPKNLLSLLRMELLSNVNFNFPNGGEGLPKIRLYIPDISQNNLMKNTPASIKQWQKAFFTYPDGRSHPIKVRLRGDAPFNWAFKKKSWRIKTKKKLMLGKRRVVDYITPKTTGILSHHMAHELARLLKIQVPDTRMVELFINKQNFGIYRETEKLDENFLRNNRLMPVNLYKGEMTDKDHVMRRDYDLFNNPLLWRKISTFNQLPDQDYSDLAYFLELVRNAETNKEDFRKLKRVARIEDWAPLNVLHILAQGWANDWVHNQRLIIDPWRGTVEPILQDNFITFDTTAKDLRLNPHPHPLFSLYSKSSEFLWEKYRILYDAVHKGIYSDLIGKVNALWPTFKQSLSRDHFLDWYSIRTNKLISISASDVEKEWDFMKSRLLEYQHTILDRLTGKPDLTWQSQNGTLDLTITGVIPASQITVTLDQNAGVPATIAWDQNGDGLLSEKDPKIPFTIHGSELTLNAIFMANHVNVQTPPFAGFSSLGNHPVHPVPTRFTLIADSRLNPLSLQSANALTRKMYLFGSGAKIGATPSVLNRPVIKKQLFETHVWSGSIHIEKDTLVDHPVKILPGTTIKMSEKASLVFRNQLIAKGSADKPITIKSRYPGKYWGVVALQGAEASGSRLSHLTLENGSGAWVENILYTGMLSLHEVKNVILDNLKLGNNIDFDDMMHVIYSEDVQLNNCLLENSFSDALDVDISTMQIRGCTIVNSRNDGIDAMSSNILIQNTKLVRSRDKGVSVGENSEVLIFNSKLNENFIGIESKDDSRAYIVNSKLNKNTQHINAITKNWRYGRGGTVITDKVALLSSSKDIFADTTSKIFVYDSTTNQTFPEIQNRFEVDQASDETGDLQSGSQNYNPLVSKVLHRWKLEGFPSLRGTIQQSISK